MSPTAAAGHMLTELVTGAVVASEYAWTLTNRSYRADGTVPGFVFCGGAHAGGYDMAFEAGFAMELARRGYPVISGDFTDIPTGLGKVDGPGAWGKDAALTAMGTYKTFLQGALGAMAGKIGLLYGSHGCAAAYGYAAANPASVSLIAGVCGTVDVEDIRANNRNGFQAEIESRYVNNAGWQAARPTHNPVEIAASLTVPQLDYYADDDPICVLSTHQALGTAAGSHITQVSMGTHGHNYAGLDTPTATYVGAFADWVVAHLS